MAKRQSRKGQTMILYNNAAHPVGILFSCGKHLHGRIVAIRGEIWFHKLVQPRHFLLQCLYQDKKVGGHVFMCWGVSILPLLTILIFDFGIVPTV